eukprot:4460394-Pyramimonas_sp.AAC.1
MSSCTTPARGRAWSSRAAASPGSSWRDATTTPRSWSSSAWGSDGHEYTGMTYLSHDTIPSNVGIPTSEDQKGNSFADCP